MLITWYSSQLDVSGREVRGRLETKSKRSKTDTLISPVSVRRNLILRHSRSSYLITVCFDWLTITQITISINPLLLGFPLSFMTSLPFIPPLLSATLFALLFPVFIVLSSAAMPYPVDLSELPLSAEDGLAGRPSEDWLAEEKWSPAWPKSLPVLCIGMWGSDFWLTVRRQGLSTLSSR